MPECCRYTYFADVAIHKVSGVYRLSPPPPPLVDSAQGSNVLGFFLGRAENGLRKALTYHPAPY
jgi:hypothetical protein